MSLADFKEGSALDRFFGTGFRGFVPSIAWASSLALMIASAHPFLHLLGAFTAVLVSSALPLLVSGESEWRKVSAAVTKQTPLVLIGALLATGFASTNLAPIGFLLIFWASYVSLSGYLAGTPGHRRIRTLKAIFQASTTRPLQVIAVILCQAVLPMLFPVFVLAGLTISQSFCHAATFDIKEEEA